VALGFVLNASALNETVSPFIFTGASLVTTTPGNVLYSSEE
jgi:hypothetical protein